MTAVREELPPPPPVVVRYWCTECGRNLPEPNVWHIPRAQLFGRCDGVIETVQYRKVEA